MKIGVSYLKSDNYERCIKKINKTDADVLHVDMCDGKYVESKNFEIDSLINLLECSTKKLDVHLMVQNPIEYIRKMKHLNVETFTVHLKTSSKLIDTLKEIKSMGFKCGIAINPDEEISSINPYLGLIDRVLIMSVFPGKGGQKFIPEVLNKVSSVNKIKDKYSITTSIDGGVNLSTIEYLKGYNIDLIITGSYITLSNDFQKSISDLRVNI